MFLLVGLLVLGISVLLIRSQPDTDPITAGEVDIPKVEEGEELGRVYGTYWISDPQVHWWGDVDAVPIKSSSGGKK